MVVADFVGNAARTVATMVVAEIAVEAAVGSVVLLAAGTAVEDSTCWCGASSSSSCTTAGRSSTPAQSRCRRCSQRRGRRSEVLPACAVCMYAFMYVSSACVTGRRGRGRGSAVRSGRRREVSPPQLRGGAGCGDHGAAGPVSRAGHRPLRDMPAGRRAGLMGR